MALAKATTDLHTNNFNQAVMAEFCERGFFGKHIRKMRGLYSRNCGLMLETMETRFPPEVVWTNPEGGISLWVTMPPAIDSMELFMRARDRGIIFTPGKLFFHGNDGHNNFRLNFSRVNPSEIKRGIEVLGRLMHEILDEVSGKSSVRERGTTPLV
jgi:2-aminoadipate transaminase